MGKRIRVRRLGKGTPLYRVKEGKYKNKYVLDGSHYGEIVEFVKNSTSSSPLAKILTEKGNTFYYAAIEGTYVGQKIKLDAKDNLNVGDIAQLKYIPTGYPIAIVEKVKYDGGKLIRSAGAFGLIVTKDDKYAYVQLPSKKTISLNLENYAVIGNVAGGEKKTIPFVKAGNKLKAKKKKGKKYVKVRGIAMNAVDHPHGGSYQKKSGKAVPVARGAPPGRKVGHIAARRTGRKKR